MGSEEPVNAQGCLTRKTTWGGPKGIPIPVRREATKRPHGQRVGEKIHLKKRKN